MRIVITQNADWQEFNVRVCEELLERGYTVELFTTMRINKMAVEVPEWGKFLSVLWHVWAVFSRVSDYGKFFRMRYQVKVGILDEVYPVSIRMTPNGIVYGSIAL